MKGNVDPREENLSRAEIDRGNKSAKFGALKGGHLSAPNICKTRPRSKDQVVDSAGDEELTVSSSLVCRDQKNWWFQPLSQPNGLMCWHVEID
jgi:hypothetical protein